MYDRTVVALPPAGGGSVCMLLNLNMNIILLLLVLLLLLLLGDAATADFPSKMAQLAAICKIQLDQEST